MENASPLTLPAETAYSFGHYTPLWTRSLRRPSSGTGSWEVDQAGPMSEDGQSKEVSKFRGSFEAARVLFGSVV